MSKKFKNELTHVSSKAKKNPGTRSLVASESFYNGLIHSRVLASKAKDALTGAGRLKRAFEICNCSSYNTLSNRNYFAFWATVAAGFVNFMNIADGPRNEFMEPIHGILAGAIFVIAGLQLNSFYRSGKLLAETRKQNPHQLENKL